jgi:hypothetical protein
MFIALCVGGFGLLGFPPGRRAVPIEKLNPPAPPPPKIVQSTPVLIAADSVPAMLRLRETFIVVKGEPAVGLKITSVVNEANEFSKAPWFVEPPVVVIKVPRWPWLDVAVPW